MTPSSLVMQSIPENRQPEGLAFALSFIRNKSQQRQERLEDGKKAVALLRQRLDEIDNVRGITHFVWGGLIHVLKVEELWKEMDGFEDWMSFADFSQKCLRMSVSKAYQLEYIWQKALIVGMEEEEIERIGWPVSKRILEIAKNRGDVEELMSRFYDSPTNEMFFDEIKEMVAQKQPQQKDGSNEESARKINRMVRLTENEATFYDETISRAAERTGKLLGVSTSPVHCLLFILSEWRSSLK